ncbi:MAG: glycosyltransferase [Acidimicrobiia bacterium]|nr:glycosyltransferase [Acidimicrobiia bacterium]
MAHSAPPGDDRTGREGEIESVLLSIVIPSHQRRDSLRRLLDSVSSCGAETNGSLEVVVVLDGSTDGSAQMLREADADFPLRWKWQEHAGQAAARNAGVSMAAGRLIWLLDDDNTVVAGSITAHLRFHEATGSSAVLLGPQLESGPDGEVLDWMVRRIDRLTVAEAVTSPFDFWSGNASLPRDVLRAAGGFDDTFVGWGEEDVELGFRLRDAGVPVRFDPAAAVRHHRTRRPRTEIREQRERGRNLVRLCARHPEALHRSFHAARPVRFLHRHGIRRPLVYGCIASVAGLLLAVDRVGTARHRRRLLALGRSASRLAGVLEAGGSVALERAVAESPRPVDADTDVPGEHPSLRTELQRHGMVAECLPIADRSVLAPLMQDATRFEAEVARLRARGAHRVPYAFTPAIRAAASDANIIAAVTAALGDRDWVAWGPNITVGTPNDAHEWHNDIESAYWPTITVALGVKGCDPANATKYVPGSHRLRRGPRVSGDVRSDERVLAAARLLDPRCDSIARFDGFGDGRFCLFDAKGWHRGDADAASDRVVLFLHYQRAGDRRIPYMRDHTTNAWFGQAAPYMVAPSAGSTYERAVHGPPSRSRSMTVATKRWVHRFAPSWLARSGARDR